MDMTPFTFNLPKGVAKQAKSIGLLTQQAMLDLVEDALRRDAGRKLLAMLPPDAEPLPDEEIVAEVKAARRARRQASA